MTSIICSAQSTAGFRFFGLGKPTTHQHTPISPTFGVRGAAHQRLPQSGAMSLNAGDMQSNIFASFVHPDVPAERKPQVPQQRAIVVKPEINDSDNESLQSKLGKPRFRSALEHVSYLTNESAMRRQ